MSSDRTTSDDNGSDGNRSDDNSGDGVIGTGQDRVIRLERVYDATPGEVWDAWTNPARLARWLGRLDEPLGDRPVRLRFGDEVDDWADLTVVRSQFPTLLELQWGFVGVDASMLTVTIDELDAGTRVTIEHRGLGTSAVGYGAGWAAYLVRLSVELQVAVDDGVTWDERFALLYPEWQRLAQRSSSATG